MADKNVPHGPEFFDQMRECRAAYVRLGDAFGEVLRGMQSVLDIGCGIGVQTARLCELGIRATGVDVFDPKPEPGFPFFQLDVLEDPYPTPFDAVICTETAEHIYTSRSDRLVEVVTSLALYRVIWSAAPPGTVWEGHVNCQPAEFWLEKFKTRGFTVNDEATKSLRLHMQANLAQHYNACDQFYVIDR